jgi:RNA polymerase sigma-70 factor (family 1)
VSITNDYQLVLRLQQEDVNAFDELYEKYHKGVYLNILKLIDDVTTAQDILQEVFLTLWEKRTTIDSSQSVASWLFVVSYNRSINYLRRTLKHELSLDGHENRITGSEPADEIASRELLLREAISRLSPQKRKVLELCKLQGKSYEETAQELHLSRHTVKEYLSTAISAIKLYFRQNGALLLLLCCQQLLAFLLAGITSHNLFF